jgi:hypothetical protein
MALDLERLQPPVSELAVLALMKAKLPPCPSRSGDCSCPNGRCRRSVHWTKLPSKEGVQLALEDLARLSGLFSAAIADGSMSGLALAAKERMLAEAERILKGALGFAVNARTGGRGTCCLKPKEHTVGCRCKRLARARAMEDAE